jgi:TetR/AcrR family transcriptional repressor of nem operon
MRYDAGHKQLTRDRVLREAAGALRQHGPAGISVSDLMAKAGLTHGGFYAHFKSKDDLIAEAIPVMFEDRAALFRACMEGVSADEGLGRYVDRYLSTRHRERPDRGCPLAALSGELARLPARARRRFEAGVRATVGEIAEVLRTLGRPQPEPLAASLLAEMVGALTLARAVPSAELAQEILDAARCHARQRAGLPAA